MAAALPWLAAISAGLNIVNQISSMANRPDPPPAPPTLSWEEAQKRSAQALDPLYDQYLTQTLQNLDQSAIARGFFGQMPAAALSGARAADIQADRVSQIAQLAQQMVGQSEQAALQQQALAQQWLLAQQAARQQAGQDALNTWSTLAHYTGMIPGTQNLTNLFRQQLENHAIPNIVNAGYNPTALPTTMPAASGASSQPASGTATAARYPSPYNVTKQYWLNPY